MQNGTAAMENNLAVSYQIKYSCHMIQQLCPLVFTQEFQTYVHTNKYLYGIDKSFTHNYQNLVATNSRWMHKLRYIQTIEYY